MSDALLSVPPEQRVSNNRLRSVSPPSVRPAPTSNMFYEGSRFYYDAPTEPQPPLCTCKVECGKGGGQAQQEGGSLLGGAKGSSRGKAGLAAIKCYSCVKFDTFGKGWFCQPCFEKLHPWYREAHKWVPIDQDDDVEYDLQVANYQAELDRTVTGFKTLLAGVRASQEICNKLDSDTRPSDMLKQNAQQMDKASKRVWELKHYVRSQLLASRDDAAVQDLEYDDEHRRLKERVPYRTASGLTPYARKLHGDGAKVGRRQATAAMRRGEERPDLTPDAAAIIVQCRARQIVARNTALAIVSMNYQRHWSWRHGAYYYTDLRSKVLSAALSARSQQRGVEQQQPTPKHKTRWARPPAVRRGMEAVVLTPRSFRTVHGRGDCADLEFLKVNRVVNAGRGPRKPDEGPLEVDEEGNPIFDPGYFERNPTDGVASPDSLSLLPPPSSFQMSPNTRRAYDALQSRMRSRVLVLSRRLAALRSAKERAAAKGPVSREAACKRLQGACRIWLARKELAARAEYIFYLVQPEAPKLKKKAGKKPRPYYFNILTRKSYWNKPKCFGSKSAKVVTAEEAVKRSGRLESRLGRRVFDVDLTYPPTEAARGEAAAVYVQCLVREFLARARVRAATRTVWEERVDEETEMTYYHNRKSGADVWERPWSPSVVLERMGRFNDAYY